jgi:hypothetical protein
MCAFPKTLVFNLPLIPWRSASPWPHGRGSSHLALLVIYSYSWLCPSFLGRVARVTMEDGQEVAISSCSCPDQGLWLRTFLLPPMGASDSEAWGLVST